jgi:hypothetical protein
LDGKGVANSPRTPAYWSQWLKPPLSSLKIGRIKWKTVIAERKKERDVRKKQ